MNRAELKGLAKQQIRGNIGTLFLVELIFALIVGVLSLLGTIGSIANVVMVAPLSLGIITIYLNLTIGQQPAVGDLFSGFDQLWPAMKVILLTGLFTVLWSLLFWIPGIIKAYSYSQAMYILAENPGMGAREAIKRSEAMMEGHKMERFVLELSFLGWGLLCVVTCGIALIWVIPYMNATFANFYNKIQAEQVEFYNRVRPTATVE